MGNVSHNNERPAATKTLGSLFWSPPNYIQKNTKLSISMFAWFTSQSFCPTNHVHCCIVYKFQLSHNQDWHFQAPDALFITSVFLKSKAEASPGIMGIEAPNCFFRLSSWSWAQCSAESPANIPPSHILPDHKRKSSKLAFWTSSITASQHLIKPRHLLHWWMLANRWSCCNSCE